MLTVGAVVPLVRLRAEIVAHEQAAAIVARNHEIRTAVWRRGRDLAKTINTIKQMLCTGVAFFPQIATFLAK